MPFLCGKKGWRANFDWFVANHKNACGVLEGKYDDLCDQSARLNQPDTVGRSDLLEKPDAEQESWKPDSEEQSRQWREVLTRHPDLRVEDPHIWEYLKTKYAIETLEETA
jgi:hypothetical protein